MFKKIVGMFKSKPAPNPEVAALVEKAHVVGRQAASDFSDELEAYLAARYAEVQPKFLALLRDQMTTAREQTDISPVNLTKLYYTSFAENVDLWSKSLLDEAKAALHHWDEVHEQMGVTSEIDALLRQLLIERAEEFKQNGFAIVRENVALIKQADAEWRAANPALAAQQPL